MNRQLLVVTLALLAACGQPAPPVARESNATEPRGGAQPAPAERSAAPQPEPSPKAVGDRVSECLKQDGQRIPANRLKALGTEPFWAAEIEGRCVTYSTPEDQDGTRIWTRFEGSAESGSWTGYLDDRRFILRTRPQPDCSDGMSDNRYPMAASLTVRGEERTGCALPL